MSLLYPRTALFILLVTLVCFLTLAVNALGQPDETTPGSDSAKVSATQVDSEKTQTEQDSHETQKPASWIDRFDGLFGEWVVGPLYSVLFFSFWTEKWIGCEIPIVVAWLFFGAVFFTIRMKFINIRAFWHAICVTKGDFDDPNDAGEVSHFQALASALSATVGLGNIAGVAIAVGTGGPGAIFWLILTGIFGMSLKFSECTLGQLYRKVDRDGTVSGGPMHYLRDGLADVGFRRTGAVLATLFAIVCMGGSFGGGCVFQVSQSLEALRTKVTFIDNYPWVFGLVLAFVVGIVIIGGIRRIAATAEKIVPFMCTIYVLAAIYIL
ncbi:MAG: sodium:alanine symporter family protein, partial [Pirellulales bacterium]|nr:sodium:alanine symporter family protein [Pirellulales bacterium]